MTVLVVMAVVSIALAMSYAILRSQTSTIQLQQNSDRTNQARQAALAGLSAGLRAMRLSSWSGVGSTLAASVSTTDSYSVTFAAGDASLTPTSANYSKYPYRVTLTSTGTSVDLAHVGVSTTWKAQAVAQLVAKELSPDPPNWSTMMGYTLYQLDNDLVYLALPCHVDGPVRLQGQVDIETPYTWNSPPQGRYFSDLNLMRTGVNEVQSLTRVTATGGTFTLTFNGTTTLAIPYSASASAIQTALRNLSTVGTGNVTVTGSFGNFSVTFVGQLGLQDVPLLEVDNSNLTGINPYVLAAVTTPGGAATADYRQFSGPVNMPFSETDTTNRGFLSSQLAITLNDISISYSSLTVSSATTYRLYPGGPTYNFAPLPSTSSNVTLTPDPVTNPLGIFYASSNATLANNVNVTGTIVTSGRLTITGTNVQISPFQLSPLDASTTPIRLPSVIGQNGFQVDSGASAAITGIVYCGHDFMVDTCTENTALAITGNVIVDDGFQVQSRTEWNAYSATEWDTYYTLFAAQLQLSNAIPFFPKWFFITTTRNYVPLVTIKADSSTVVPHWQDWSTPVFAIPSASSGLQWDIVSWTDRF